MHILVIKMFHLMPAPAVMEEISCMDNTYTFRPFTSNTCTNKRIYRILRTA